MTAFHDVVREYFRGALKPPFNDDARARAGLTPAWYLPLAEEKSVAASRDEGAREKDDTQSITSRQHSTFNGVARARTHARIHSFMHASIHSPRARAFIRRPPNARRRRRRRERPPRPRARAPRRRSLASTTRSVARSRTRASLAVVALVVVAASSSSSSRRFLRSFFRDSSSQNHRAFRARSIAASASSVRIAVVSPTESRARSSARRPTRRRSVDDDRSMMNSGAPTRRLRRPRLSRARAPRRRPRRRHRDAHTFCRPSRASREDASSSVSSSSSEDGMGMKSLGEPAASTSAGRSRRRISRVAGDRRRLCASIVVVVVSVGSFLVVRIAKETLEALDATS